VAVRLLELEDAHGRDLDIVRCDCTRILSPFRPESYVMAFTRVVAMKSATILASSGPLSS